MSVNELMKAVVGDNEDKLKYLLSTGKISQEKYDEILEDLKANAD